MKCLILNWTQAVFCFKKKKTALKWIQVWKSLLWIITKQVVLFWASCWVKSISSTLIYSSVILKKGFKIHTYFTNTFNKVFSHSTVLTRPYLRSIYNNGENLPYLNKHIIKLIIRATTESERDRISLLILVLFYSLVMRGHQHETNVLF